MLRVMALDPAELPDDIATLKVMLIAAEKRADVREQEIKNLKLDTSIYRRFRLDGWVMMTTAKSTTADSRSSGSPPELSCRKRSSRSKKPGCPAITTPSHASSAVNQIKGDSGRFLEVSS